jgi:putative NADH-flavin reductase
MQSMRVTVFGAASGVGRLLVTGAHERGHEVTALVLEPGDLGATDANVRIVRGDVLDGGAVSDAVDGAEAVLVALPTTPTRDAAPLIPQGTLNVIRSMQRYRVRRLVVLSAAGAQTPRDADGGRWFDRFMRPRSRRQALADVRRMEIGVRQSQLDWTLVRAARLVDGPARGRYRIGPGHSLPGGTRISRADVAAFMLDELERSDNVTHALAIAD